MMGFGKFFKKVINPLTPFKAGAKSIGQLAKGNIKGAFRSSLDAVPGSPTIGMGGGPPDAARRDAIRAAAGFDGPMGMGSLIRGRKIQPEMEGMGQPPPPQMGMAPGVASALQGAMQQMGQPAPGPSPLQAGIQEMIGPQESNPYEAWKAGGRSGARPAGY